MKYVDFHFKFKSQLPRLSTRLLWFVTNNAMRLIL